VSFEPIVGKPVRLPPPGRVEVRLNQEHRRLYRALYARFQTVVAGLPVLREDRDFDGRRLKMARSELDTLNEAFAAEAARDASGGLAPESVFEGQARGRSRLFKRLQYLS
jgi:hypothetical protein